MSETTPRKGRHQTVKRSGSDYLVQVGPTEWKRLGDCDSADLDYIRKQRLRDLEKDLFWIISRAEVIFDGDLDKVEAWLNEAAATVLETLRSDATE